MSHIEQNAPLRKGQGLNGVAEAPFIETEAPAPAAEHVAGTNGQAPVQGGAESPPRAPSWRDNIEEHPAAGAFPLMRDTDPAGLAAFGKDIKEQGLQRPIALWRSDKNAPAQLLDGRNRADAIELALERPVRFVSRTFRGRTAWGLEADDEEGESVPVTDLVGESAVVVLERDTDPWKYVASANAHRRHLTAEQKKTVIEKLLKTAPEKSDRQIAKMVGVDHKTASAARKKLQATGEIPHLKKTVGKDGKARQQPVRPGAKSPTKKIVTAVPTIAEEPGSTEAEPRLEPEPAITHESEIEYLNGEVARLKRVNLALESEVNDLKAEVTRLHGENTALRSEVRELKSENGLRNAPAKDQGDGAEWLDIPDCLKRAPEAGRA